MFKIVHVVRWKSDVQNVKLVGYIFSPNSTTRRDAEDDDDDDDVVLDGTKSFNFRKKGSKHHEEEEKAENEALRRTNERTNGPTMTTGHTTDFWNGLIQYWYTFFVEERK